MPFCKCRLCFRIGPKSRLQKVGVAIHAWVFTIGLCHVLGRGGLRRGIRGKLKIIDLMLRYRLLRLLLQLSKGKKIKKLKENAADNEIFEEPVYMMKKVAV